MRKLIFGMAMLITATAAYGTGTPQQKCEGGKDEAAGKLTACLGKAQKKFVITGDGVALSSAIAKCNDKFAAKWQKLEQAASAAGTNCPSTADQSEVQSFVQSCNDAVADAMAGNPLIDDPQTCDTNLDSCNGSLSSCNGNLGTCNTNYSACSSSLGTCNSSLSTCNTNYSSCSSSLSTCNSNYSTCSDSLSTCNAGTAAPEDVLAGKTFSSAAGLGVTGTTTVGANVTGADGSATFTIPNGFYTESKTCTATDSDLTANNIKSGKTIFGVTGTIGFLKSGQMTSFGAGSDGAVQAGTLPSYTDNADGTITDNVTGLMWEKKDDSGGIHDRDNRYTWTTGSPYTMNGTIVTTFLAALNAGGGFAGYTDWRIPNLRELQSLVDLDILPPGPTVNVAFHKAATCTGCTDVTAESCSCTADATHWSSSTYLSSPSYAWDVVFFIGNDDSAIKTTSYRVRAVRGGL